MQSDLGLPSSASDRRISPPPPGGARWCCAAALSFLALLVPPTRGQGELGPRALPDPATLDFVQLSEGEVLALVAESQARGDHGRALTVLQGALEALARQERPPKQLFVQYHFHVAEAQRSLRRFEEALDASEESRRWLGLLFDETDPLDPRTEALLAWAENERCSLIGQRGWIYLDWGRLESARALFDEERRELEALGELASAGSHGDSLLHRANLACVTGTPEEVEALLSEAGDELAPRLHAHLRLSRATAGFERARREGLPLEDVRVAYERASADPDLDPVLVASALLALVEVELALGRPAAARERWHAAGKRLEESGSALTPNRRRWLALGASLAQAGERSEWRVRLGKEIETFLSEWRALETREDGYGLLHFNDALRLFAEFTRLSVELDGPDRGGARAFEILASAHAENRLARRLAAPAPSLEEMRAFLCPHPEDGLLAYLAGPTSSWVLALDARQVQVRPLGSSYSLERLARGLTRELLAGGGTWTTAGRSAAREVARAFLPEELGAWVASRRRLGVCGLDLFRGDVPFELLDASGRGPLGAETAIWNLPSLAAAVEGTRRASARAPTRPSLQLVAAPTMVPEVAARYSLEGFTLEADALERILASFDVDARDVRLGEAANAAALVGATGILQFLVHGVLDGTRSPGAELALAPRGERDDGLLSAPEVERTLAEHGAPRLAVLTACRASRSATRAGDGGSVGLAGAFLAGGASAVVAAGCDLDLELACEASALFHAALVGGADVAEALRDARARLARDERFAASAQPGFLRVIGFLPETFAASAADGLGPQRADRLPGVAFLAMLLVVGAGVVCRRRARVRDSG
jgi:hypothetical protein